MFDPLSLFVGICIGIVLMSLATMLVVYLATRGGN